MEKIRASLFNSSDLIGLSSLDGEDELMELSSEEILTASTVNQSLFDTQGSSALEDYFLDKSLRGWWLNDIYSGCQRVRGHFSLFIEININFGRHCSSCPLIATLGHLQTACLHHNIGDKTVKQTLK